MLIPKASHLVERVAERLLRSGALDDSSAQLLRPSTVEPALGATDHAAAVAAPRPMVAPASRSSLFAAPPSQTKPPPSRVMSVAVAEVPAAGLDLPPDEDAAPTDDGGGPETPPLATPAIQTQSRLLGQAAVLERPADFTASTPPPGQRVLADPAAGMLQGPTSVDAVSLERAGMVDWSRTRTRISEEFRLVQRQIIRAAFGPGAEPGFSNLLLVTSARPGEGKSFMSTNLSGSIARQGDHHVLLVDADSKRDSICYSLGLAQARGLLDLAANPKLDPAPLIVRTPIERLSILPVGRERERSAELFSTKEMTRLIQSLGRRYADRLLILDAPPCLSTSDPAVLAQVVGQILFVVEADLTQRDEIEASLDLIQACPTITMVLNKQQISSRYTFGAYSSYTRPDRAARDNAMISGELLMWRRTAAKGWSIAGLGTALLLAQAGGAAAFPLIDPTNQGQAPQGTDLAGPDVQTLQHQLQLANGFGAPAGGGWTIVPSLSVDEMFTDNVLQANSPRRWDLVTLITPGISVAGDLPRLQLKLDYNPTLSLAARTGSQNAISQSLNSTALVTLVPDLAFVDLRALASVQSTTGLLTGTSAGNVGTSVSATNNTVGLSNQDRTQTSNFQISPYLLHRFGDFGTGKLGVSASETQYATSTGFAVSPFPTGGGQGEAQLTTEQIAQFTTGNILERFTDEISIDLTQTTSSANSVISAAGNATAIPRTTFSSRRDVIQDQLNYAASRWAKVFGTIGHENITFSQELAQKINDLTWSVGVSLAPNADSDLTISYGHQNGSNSIQASAHYALTARTTISGSYSQTLGTELQQVESQVQFGIIGPNGQFISGANGQPLIFNAFETNDVQAVYRFNTFSMNVVTTLDRDTLSFALVLGNQTTTGGIPSSSIFDTVTAQWQHSLRPDLILSSAVTYTRQTQTGGQQCFGTLLYQCGGPNLGDSTLYSGTSVLTYTLTDSLSTHIRLSFYDRTSPLAVDRFYQSLLLVGFTKTF